MVFSIRAAPHLASDVPFGAVIVSVWDHRKPGSADRSAVFINADVVMDCFGMSAFAVEKPVSGQVVHSGIEAHILYGKTGHMFFQLMESNKERD